MRIYQNGAIYHSPPRSNGRLPNGKLANGKVSNGIVSNGENHVLPNQNRHQNGAIQNAGQHEWKVAEDDEISNPEQHFALSDVDSNISE